MRCSRPFALAGGGAALMTSLMGPGALRADHYRADGTVMPRAHLTVMTQAATRLFGGGLSTSTAHWRVADGAFLELLNEPVVPFAHADCDLRTTLEIAPSARVASLDLVSLTARTPCVLRSRLQITVAQRYVVHDRFELRREPLEGSLAIGTFVFCDPADSTSGAALFEAVEAIETTGVRIGIGRPRCGGLFARIIAAHPWAVRETLHRIRAAVFSAAGLPSEVPRGLP